MSAPVLETPLALYVHLPWCVRKCPYCDFNSYTAPAQLPQAAYIDALLEDLDVDAAFAGGRKLISIFFGGGTPSLFAPEEIARFIEGVHARMGVADDVEITLEANPGTVEHGRFTGYRAAGVNRVSLGVQSFQPKQLQALGRIHGAEEPKRAVAELRDAGFENFNLDLMYGLPEQSVEEALADLDMALVLQPTHVSHYQLTLEPGTVFYHRPPPLPDDESIWAMQERSQARLAEAGYAQYEVSAYARASKHCRHNLNYWTYGDYIGVGAGAHGKLSREGAKEIVRTSRTRSPREYLNSTAQARRTVLAIAEQDRGFEFCLNALRLATGFRATEFEMRTGLSFAAVEHAVDRARRRGLLERVEDRWRPTELGRRFLNDLQAMFLPEQKPLAASSNGAA